jgi:hypothetical protein
MIKTMVSLRNVAARASMRAPAVAVTKVGAQIVVLWVIFAVSNAVVARLGLRVPGNIVGLALLFVLLSAGIVKERWRALLDDRQLQLGREGPDGPGRAGEALAWHDEDLAPARGKDLAASVSRITAWRLSRRN